MMLKKILKIELILLVILFTNFSYVFATDIDLNLLSNDENSTLSENVDGTNSSSGQATVDHAYDTLGDYEALQPTAANSATQTGLTTSDIINILLITVGVILILLAIAIMIRLK